MAPLPLTHWETKMRGWMASVIKLQRNPRTITWFWALDDPIRAAWKMGYVTSVLGGDEKLAKWRLSAKGLRHLKALMVLRRLKEAS